MPIKHIRWTVHRLGPIAFISLLSGCLGLNDVKPLGLSFGGTPPADRAYVIFALSVEAKRRRLDVVESFSTHLDEYSIERRNITWNCWWTNYMQASVPEISETRQYFVFDVKPGYYLAPLEYRDTNFMAVAFEVPPGRIVYLGDVIFTSERQIGLKRDLDAVRSYFPGNDVVLAETREVPPVQGALCMP